MCGCRYWGHGYLVYGPYQVHYIYQFHFTFLTVILIKWWLIWWYITIWKSYYQMLTHMVIYHKLIVKSPNDSSASPCHGPCDSMRSPFDSIPSPSDLFELPSDFEITKWDHHLRYHHLAPCRFMDDYVQILPIWKVCLNLKFKSLFRRWLIQNDLEKEGFYSSSRKSSLQILNKNCGMSSAPKISDSHPAELPVFRSQTSGSRGIDRRVFPIQTIWLT